MENGITIADLTVALTALKTEIVSEVTEKMQTMNDELTEKMQTMNDDVVERMRQIETNLLTEFHRYGKGQQLRLHTLESHEAVVTERLALIEERLLHLESRRPPTV
jgi:hypothetical protein